MYYVAVSRWIQQWGLAFISLWYRCCTFDQNLWLCVFTPLSLYLSPSLCHRSSTLTCSLFLFSPLGNFCLAFSLLSISHLLSPTLCLCLSLSLSHTHTHTNTHKYTVERTPSWLVVTGSDDNNVPGVQTLSPLLTLPPCLCPAIWLVFSLLVHL